jgi:hypothetical protein
MAACLVLLALCSITTSSQAFFVPSAPTARSSSLVLNVNVATYFILQEFERNAPPFMSASDDGEIPPSSAIKTKLSRPDRKAAERKRKSAVEVTGKQRQSSKDKDASKVLPSSGDRYKLHSQAISSLTSESTADNVLRAIKRAQNLKDADDIRTISKFLLEEVDEHFAFGYRGSLLSRLAVAALHMNNHELARTAIDQRRREFRGSMLPMESAAIIRGLLRVHNVTDALELLDDELSLPMQVSCCMYLQEAEFAKSL